MRVQLLLFGSLILLLPLIALSQEAALKPAQVLSDSDAIAAAQARYWEDANRPGQSPPTPIEELEWVPTRTSSGWSVHYEYKPSWGEWFLCLLGCSSWAGANIVIETDPDGTLRDIRTESGFSSIKAELP